VSNGCVHPKIECEEQRILSARYHADLKVYIEAATSLDSAVGEEFQASWENAERARVAFEDARALLLKHQAEHGCF
jgi:hypothetical protein